MTTRDTETLAQLISARAGKRSGAPLSFDDLSDISVDPETGYKPSGSHLWKIARGEDVKISPKLIRALKEGLGLPIERIQAAAARQYLGWQVAVDPGIETDTDEDEVIRVSTVGGVTPSETGHVEEFVRRSRTEDASDEG